MIQSDKVIVSAAVTGSVHVPSMSEYLPVTPDEIGTAAIDAAKAGAAIVHLHARHDDGRPSADPKLFERFVPRIAAEVDAVINISTGGSSQMTNEERLAAATQFSPELASLNMGTMNFVFSGIAEKISDWKFGWERDYVLNTYAHPFVNTFDMIEHTLRELGEKGGTKFEYECYDIGHLYSLAYFANKGLAKPPFLIQGVFGVLGGIGADHENLTHMIAIADKLFGKDYYFSAFAAGRQQMNFATNTALLGGQVRVGLEDNLFIGKGRKAVSSAEQVEKVIRILTEMGKTIATPTEARTMLQLKGRAATRMG